MTPEALEALIVVLKRHGVSQYRDGELALVLSPFSFEEPAAPASATPPPTAREDDPLFDHTR